MRTEKSIVIAAIFIALVGGCASQTEHGAGGSKESVELNPAFDNAHQARRKAVDGARFGWVITRSIYSNPINRPVSHFGSLASLALKSTGGAIRRFVISTVEMPALSGNIPDISFAEPMDLVAFEARLDEVTGTERVRGRIKFLVDGEEYFERLTTEISNARDSVDIRTYIFDNDDYAVEIADLLKDRSHEIRVRIMLDSLGTTLALQADSDSMPVEHRVPLSMHRYLEKHSNVNVRSLTNPWFTGDHTKTTIIDRKLAFVGGMNIGREYRYDWHDLMMEISGPVVDKLQYESDKAWARAGLLGDLANFVAFVKGQKTRAGDSGYPIRVLQTRNFDSDIHKAQIAAIQNATSYILIENPYFSDDRTVYELAKARRRGVDVRVIIPSQGNHGPLNASNKVTINTLLQHGIRVYAYPGMSHVKAAVFDGWASVGSANFDKLSLKVNKELNLATSDPDTVAALMDQVFIPDLLVSKEISSPFDVTVTAQLAEILVDELL